MAMPAYQRLLVLCVVLGLATAPRTAHAQCENCMRVPSLWDNSPRDVLSGNSGMDPVELKPLGDRWNPYDGEYEAWDLWILEHAVSADDPEVLRYYREEGQRSNTVLSAYVDSDGYLVPQRVAESRKLHAWAEGDQPQNYPARWSHMLVAAGPIDRELLSTYEQSMLALRAEYALPVPAWLAELKPAWALILPPEASLHAGEVVVYGPPGVRVDRLPQPGEGRPPHSREIFFRYSPNGQLLGKTKVGQQWWELYASNPATPEKAHQPTYYSVFESDGIISVVDLKTGKRAWLMNYDGQLLPDVKEPQPRNRNYWSGFSSSELTYLFELQQGRVQRPGLQQAPAKFRPVKAAAPKPPPMGGRR